MQVNYCSSCGAAMENRDVDGTVRRACTRCDFVHWGNYSIGVGALVVKDGKLLLVRRAQDPGKGYWTTPGGYIEQLEPIQATIEREVLEESGVKASVEAVVALRDQPRSIHNVYIAFKMKFEEGEPAPDGMEVDGAGFFGPEEMAEMNVAPFTRWLADIAMSDGGFGLVQDAAPIVPLNGYGLFRA